MKSKTYIQHTGVVERIEKDKVFVKIEQQTACNECHAKSACLSSGKKEKIIEVKDASGDYSLHERVVVSVQSSMGLFAALVAFIIPLALVVLALFAVMAKSGNEGIAGLVGLAVLFLYYLILFFFRDKLNNKFIFTLSKAEPTLLLESKTTITY